MVLSLQDTPDQLEEQKLNRGIWSLRESKNSQTEKSVDMLKIQIWLHIYKQGRTGQECESWCQPWLPLLMGCWVPEKWQQGTKHRIITLDFRTTDCLEESHRKHICRVIEWKQPSSSNSPAIGRDTSNDKEFTTSLGYLILRTSANQVWDLVLFGLIEWSSHGPTPQACQSPSGWHPFPHGQINNFTQLGVVCRLAKFPFNHNMSLIKILNNICITRDP